MQMSICQLQSLHMVKSPQEVPWAGQAVLSGAEVRRQGLGCLDMLSQSVL